MSKLDSELAHATLELSKYANLDNDCIRREISHKLIDLSAYPMCQTLSREFRKALISEMEKMRLGYELFYTVEYETRTKVSTVMYLKPKPRNFDQVGDTVEDMLSVGHDRSFFQDLYGVDQVTKQTIYAYIIWLEKEGPIVSFDIDFLYEHAAEVADYLNN